MIMKMRDMLKRKNGQKGFTLVELIVVMAILAILAAIAVPRYGASLDKAKQQAVETNVMMISKAAELAYANGVAATDINMKKLVTDKYLDAAPKVGVTYTYKGVAYTKDHWFQVTVTENTGTTVGSIAVAVSDSATDPTL